MEAGEALADPQLKDALIAALAIDSSVGVPRNSEMTYGPDADALLEQAAENSLGELTPEDVLASAADMRVLAEQLDADLLRRYEERCRSWRSNS